MYSWFSWLHCSWGDRDLRNHLFTKPWSSTASSFVWWIRGSILILIKRFTQLTSTAKQSIFTSTFSFSSFLSFLILKASHRWLSLSHLRLTRLTLTFTFAFLIGGSHGWLSFSPLKVHTVDFHFLLKIHKVDIHFSFTFSHSKPHTVDFYL